MLISTNSTHLRLLKGTSKHQKKIIVPPTKARCTYLDLCCAGLDQYSLAHKTNLERSE